MNIELKAPVSEECKARYCCKKTAEIVYALLNKHDMHGKFMISSFGAEILKQVEDVRKKHEGIHPSFEIIYLWNNENQPLPSPDIYTAKGDGVNISANHLTVEVFEICKAKGLKVGVWISASNF